MSTVPVSSVDFADLTYFTGYKCGIGEIKQSLRDIGLINPPVLIRTGEQYRIVTGWKRLLACRELGYKEIECTVHEPGELLSEQSLKLIYEDNKERLCDLEISEILAKFKEQLSLEDKDIIKSVMPVLGLPPSLKHLDRYRALSSLELPIKEAYYNSKITIEQAQALTELRESDRLQAMNSIILKYKLNSNESKQVINDIKEITLRDEKPFSEVIKELESGSGSERIDKAGLRRRIKIIRYPSLYKAESAYSEVLEHMKLPPDIDIVRHPYFETNEIEIRIKVNDSEGLSNSLNSLTESAENGNIEKLLLIIRYGAS